MPPAGLGYQRGMGGVRPWDSRLPHSFLSTSMKHAAMRFVKGNLVLVVVISHSTIRFVIVCLG